MTVYPCIHCGQEIARPRESIMRFRVWKHLLTENRLCPQEHLAHELRLIGLMAHPDRY